MRTTLRHAGLAVLLLAAACGEANDVAVPAEPTPPASVDGTTAPIPTTTPPRAEPTTRTTAPAAPVPTVADPPIPTPPTVQERPAPTGDLLVRYRMPGGECDRCDFDLSFRSDATVVLRSTRGDVTADFELATLRDLLAGFDRSELVVGPADCGREVDGNAPILTVDGEEIDLCFAETRPDDPLLGFLEVERTRVGTIRDDRSPPPRLVAVVEDFGGLCVSGGCVSGWKLWSDGTWTLDDGLAVSSGSFDVAALEAALPALAEASPEQGEFTGTCPVAHDGTERRYAVYDDGDLLWGGRTCDRRIDGDHPLVRALDAIVAPAR